MLAAAVELAANAEARGDSAGLRHCLGWALAVDAALQAAEAATAAALQRTVGEIRDEQAH